MRILNSVQIKHCRTLNIKLNEGAGLSDDYFSLWNRLITNLCNLNDDFILNVACV